MIFPRFEVPVTVGARGDLEIFPRLGRQGILRLWRNFLGLSSGGMRVVWSGVHLIRLLRSRLRRNRRNHHLRLRCCPLRHFLGFLLRTSKGLPRKGA